MRLCAAGHVSCDMGVTTNCPTKEVKPGTEQASFQGQFLGFGTKWSMSLAGTTSQ